MPINRNKEGDSYKMTETAVRPPRGQRRGTLPPPNTSEADHTAVGEGKPLPSRKGTMSKGWLAVDTKRGGGHTGFAKDLQIVDGVTYLLRFVDPEPFSVNHRHWVVAKTKNGEWKKLPFNCLADIDKACALCDTLGNTPTQQVLFNVVDLNDLETDEGDPQVKVWRVTSKQVARELRDYAADPATSPINDSNRYWVLKRTSTGSGMAKRYTTNIRPVKARDLVEDDLGHEPLDTATQEEYAGERWTDKTVNFYKMEEEIQEVADDAVKAAEMMGSTEE